MRHDDHLQLMKVNGEVDNHLKPLEAPALEQVAVPEEGHVSGGMIMVVGGYITLCSSAKALYK